MKVALIDNMNNNFFSLCRYLRDRDIDAHLYLMPDMYEHFRPEADTFQNPSELSDYVHEFPTTFKSWFLSFKKIDLKELKKYDILIACGWSLALLHQSGIKVDIFISYGSDLYESVFVKLKARKIFYYLAQLDWSKYQRQAIKECRYIISEKSNTLYREAMEQLGVDCLELGIPMVYNQPRIENDESRWDFLDKHDFIVFNQSRQIWCTDTDHMSDFKVHGGIKRNDKIIKAFTKIVSHNIYLAPILILFEYGEDVEASKQLIQELNIEKYVRWMPKMERKYIVQGLRKATFGCDQFRLGILGIAGTSYEILSEGIPLITNMEGQLENPNSKFYSAPILHALETDEIYQYFADYKNNPEKYKAIGKASLNWFNDNLGVGLADEYIDLMQKIYTEKTQ
ncbi:hypothetical protein THIOM_005085 [Candidatus Thiomargarita nelsonii]|uniref:Uncharacterized protein n=1 Tax=Candidatus Thiomargarita nelsonii TaxID=1003181 RepID=A0A176RU70_9GAMM|nr:hypothetical protein THIOM_005085 [Candidatus Thiomargarita nelsonii]